MGCLNLSTGKKKEVLNISRQMIFYKLAQFCDAYQGNDLYYLMEAVNMIRADVGDKLLKEKYKDKYKKVKDKLDEFEERIHKVKTYYDNIENWEDEEKHKKLKRIYRKEFSKLPLLNKALFKVFMILLEKTNLKYQTIPNDYFRRMERKYKIPKVEEEPIKNEG